MSSVNRIFKEFKIENSKFSSKVIEMTWNFCMLVLYPLQCCVQILSNLKDFRELRLFILLKPNSKVKQNASN